MYSTDKPIENDINDSGIADVLTPATAIESIKNGTFL